MFVQTRPVLRTLPLGGVVTDVIEGVTLHDASSVLMCDFAITSAGVFLYEHASDVLRTFTYSEITASKESVVKSGKNKLPSIEMSTTKGGNVVLTGLPVTRVLDAIAAAKKATAPADLLATVLGAPTHARLAQDATYSCSVSVLDASGASAWRLYVPKDASKPWTFASLASSPTIATLAASSAVAALSCSLADKLPSVVLLFGEHDWRALHLVFASVAERDAVYGRFDQSKKWSLEKLQQDWVQGQLSNAMYLRLLNFSAGRSPYVSALPFTYPCAFQAAELDEPSQCEQLHSWIDVVFQGTPASPSSAGINSLSAVMAAKNNISMTTCLFNSSHPARKHPTLETLRMSEASISTLTAQYKELQNQNASLKDQNDNLSRSMASQDQKINELNARRSDITSLRAASKSQAATLRNRTLRLKDSRYTTSLESKLKEVSDERTQLQVELDRCSQKASTASDRCAQLEKELSIVEARERASVKRLESEAKELSDMVEKKKAEVSEWMGKCGLLTAQIKELKVRIGEEHTMAQRTQALVAQLERREKERTRMEDKMTLSKEEREEREKEQQSQKEKSPEKKQKSDAQKTEEQASPSKTESQPQPQPQAQSQAEPQQQPQPQQQQGSAATAETKTEEPKAEQQPAEATKTEEPKEQSKDAAQQSSPAPTVASEAAPEQSSQPSTEASNTEHASAPVVVPAAASSDSSESQANAETAQPASAIASEQPKQDEAASSSDAPAATSEPVLVVLHPVEKAESEVHVHLSPASSQDESGKEVDVVMTEQPDVCIHMRCSTDTNVPEETPHAVPVAEDQPTQSEPTKQMEADALVVSSHDDAPVSPSQSKDSDHKHDSDQDSVDFDELDVDVDKLLA